MTSNGYYLVALGLTGGCIGWATNAICWRKRLVVALATSLAMALAFDQGFRRGLDTVEQAVERALHSDQQDEEPALQRVQRPAKPRLVV